jgi:NUMOD3 motif
MGIRFNKDGSVDGRSFNGSKRTLKDITCKECGIVFRPGNLSVMYCGNVCRIRGVNRTQRERGQFFGNACWTKEEDELLRQVWLDPSKSMKDIVEVFSKRTRRVLKNRAGHLRLKGIWPKRIGKKRDFFGNKNPFYGRKHSEETKQKLSEIVKKNTCFHRLNKDPEFQRKRRKAWHGFATASPNRKEKRLQRLISWVCPNEYKFVGDGTFIIDGLNPDFVNVDGQKKIIELFGKAFHHEDHCIWPLPERRTAKGRTKVFRKFGYKTLIIWDDELNTPESRKEVKNKIRKFNNS